jgi:hypothetical protein
MAETLERLRFKADLPARLGDSVGEAAVSFTEHVIDRLTAHDAEAEDQGRVTSSGSTESSVPQEADAASGHLSSSAKPD